MMVVSNYLFLLERESRMDKQSHIWSAHVSPYSLGAFGHDAFFALLSTCFMMYVTGHLFTSSDKGFDNRMVGYVTAIIMILRIVELLIDPLIGNAIDRTNTKWGKFKPWVVGGGVISAVLLAATLFHALGGLNVSVLTCTWLSFAIIYIIMDIFYSFNDVGFWSMIPAMSRFTRTG